MTLLKSLEEIARFAGERRGKEKAWEKRTPEDVRSGGGEYAETYRRTNGGR